VDMSVPAGWISMSRATRNQVNALSLLYLLDVDQLICIQVIPLERG